MDWKVSKQTVELKTHNNADSLDVIKAGPYQLVSGKGNYQNGEVIIVIPEKSLLSNGEMILAFEKYLSGTKKNRVKSVQLRGEVSQGITWPLGELETAFGARISDLILAAPIGEDISELMGITKYEPPIPAALAGEVTPVPDLIRIAKHDVNQFGIYRDEFDPEETVLVTEKIHGTQINYTLSVKEIDPAGAESFGLMREWEVIEVVASKGLLARGLALKDNPGNLYWQAAKNSKLREAAQEVADAFNVDTVTIIGEVVPSQKGYTYGFTKPEVLVFAVIAAGGYLTREDVPELSWVPLLYEGPFKDANVYELAKGKETVSGKELHIREGAVVTPFVMRRAEDGEWLKTKVINPAYSKKESGDELS